MLAFWPGWGWVNSPTGIKKITQWTFSLTFGAAWIAPPVTTSSIFHSLGSIPLHNDNTLLIGTYLQEQLILALFISWFISFQSPSVNQWKPCRLYIFLVYISCHSIWLQRFCYSTSITPRNSHLGDHRIRKQTVTRIDERTLTRTSQPKKQYVESISFCH